MILPGCPVEHLAWLSAEPYAYGSSDCCTRVADALLPVYGADLMALFRGRYSSKTGFLRLLQRKNCAGLAEALDHCLEQHGFVRTDAPWREYAIGLAVLKLANGIIEAPAFLVDGMWHGSTRDGFFAVEQVSIAWQ